MESPPNLPLPPSAFSPAYVREYNGDSLRNVSYLFIVLIVLVTSLRFYAKTLSKARFGLDDALIVGAAVTCIAICGLALWGIHIGILGYHVPAIKPDLAVYGFKIRVGIEWLYTITIAFAKVSILLFLLRIFNGKWFRRTAYLLMFIICGLCIASVFTTIFQCKPVAFAWDKTIKGGKCINTLAYFRWSMIPNIVTDVGMLISPLPIIWNLQLSNPQKIGLTAVFLTGSMGTIAACVRLSLLFKSNFDTDPSWNAVDWISWSIIEPGVYILAACFPPYRVLFSHFQVWTRLSHGISKMSKSNTFSSTTTTSSSTSSSKGWFHSSSSDRNRSTPSNHHGIGGGGPAGPAGGGASSRKKFTGSASLPPSSSSVGMVENRAGNGNVNAIWSTEEERGDVPLDGIRVKHDFQWAHAV